MASSVDPDEMAHDEPSHLDLHCLHRYLYQSTKLKGLKQFRLKASKRYHTVPSFRYEGQSIRSLRNGFLTGKDMIFHVTIVKRFCEVSENVIKTVDVVYVTDPD